MSAKTTAPKAFGAARLYDQNLGAAYDESLGIIASPSEASQNTLTDSWYIQTCIERCPNPPLTIISIGHKVQEF